MEHSRRSVLSFALGVGTGLGVPSTWAGPSAMSPVLRKAAGLVSTSRPIVVGPLGNYPDVASALASITDNGPDNPYSIFIQPGIYGGFVMKPYVDIRGSGCWATQIETSSDSPVAAAAYSTLSDMRIHYSGNSGGAYAAAMTHIGPVTEFVASNLEIDVDGIAGAPGPRWAIGWFAGSHDATFRDIKIRTESGGIYVASGHYRIHSSDCYLAGNAVGLPHIGLQVKNAARVDWFGGRLGTGYYYDQELHDPFQDVMGVYIPASNVGAVRVHLHGVIVFARNVEAVSGVRVNTVRAENGWVRLFGCMCQSEPGSTNESTTLYAVYGTPAQPPDGQGGKIEVFGSRITDFEGNVCGGSGTVGVSTYNTTHDGRILTKHEGGLVLCDASAGPFSLFLPGDMSPGDNYIFKKIDGTSNPVIIGAKANRGIDGINEQVLDVQYSTLKVVAGYDTYHLT